MTEEEALRTLRAGRADLGADLLLDIIRYDCTGGYAVISPAYSARGIWYLLTTYDGNIGKQLQAIHEAPPLVNLAPLGYIAPTMYP